MLGIFALISGKGKLAIGLVIVLAISSGVAYHFWKINDLSENLSTTREDLAQAMVNETVLKETVTKLENSQQLLLQQRERDQKRINELSKNFRATRKKVGDLRRLLSQHDLGYLMLEKPGLLEPRMNRATEELGKEFEQLTKEEEESE